MIFAVANQKGGVGKTAVAVNLSASLAMADLKVLLVDIDSQANSTSGLGVEEPDVSIYEIIGGADPRTAIHKTKIENLFLIPSKRDLAGAEVELATEPEREAKLKNVLSRIKGDFDMIILDCPPSLGLLTVNALCAADAVIIPITCEYYPLEGLSYLIRTIELVRDSVNPALKLFGILINMFDPRPNLSKQVLEEIKSAFGRIVFETKIPRNIRVAEAPSHGLPVTLYDPRSRGAEAFTSFTREFIERLRNSQASVYPD
jgi:chromosome partitioning protein